MLGRSRLSHLLRTRGLQAVPTLLLLALLGPPILQGLPSLKYQTNRKLGPAPSPAHPSDASADGSWRWWHSKPSLQQYTQQHCGPLLDTHQQLLEPMFRHWAQSGFSKRLLENTSGDRVYIQNGKLSLSNSTTLHRLIPTFVNYIQHIAELVHLPDMMLPLNPADEPLARVKNDEQPTPLLAFCKTPGFSDILMPNTIEGMGECFAALFVQHATLAPSLHQRVHF